MGKKQLRKSIDQQQTQQKKLKKDVAALKGQLTKAKDKRKKDVSTVKGQLTTAEKGRAKAVERAERWKNEAKAHQKSASTASARADALQERLDQATATLKATASKADVAAGGSNTSKPAKDTAPAAATPDDTWTVVQLRAEANARGLSGTSKMKKADLIKALS